MSEPQRTHNELNPDASPDRNRERVEGWIPELTSDEDIREALEKAFDYRGDVTLTRKDGSKIEGYIFDRRSGTTLADSAVRIIPKESREKLAIPYSDIAALVFSGRDMAAGKSWEAWLKNYWERKAAGEKNIGIQPDELE